MPLIKSDKKDTVISFFNKSLESGTSSSRILGEEIAENVIDRAVSLSKATGYSQDVDGLGGFAVRPNFLPTVNITNYTNEEKFLAFSGVTKINGIQATIGRIDYDFNDRTDGSNGIKEQSEHEEVTVSGVSTLHKPLSITLSKFVTDFSVSEKLIISDSTTLNFQLTEMEADLNRNLVRSALGKLSRFKNLGSIPAEMANVLDSNVVNTFESGNVIIEDIRERLFGAGKLLVDNLQSPMLILNDKLLNALVGKKEYGRLVNSELIDQDSQTIKTIWGRVPYIITNNISLFNPNLTGAEAGSTVAILMDRDAHKFYMSTNGSMLTQKPDWFSQQENMRAYRQSIYAGSYIVNPYKIAILKVKA